MFIPLTINNDRSPSPNVLIAGDTAGIFFILSLVTVLDVNVFLADTGIRRPLREFPCHRGNSKDRANVYYDFFDGRIGAGIVRRMDLAITSSCDLQRWTRAFQIPSIGVRQDRSGTWLDFEGAVAEAKPSPNDSASGTAGMLISNFINGARGYYRSISSRALIDEKGAAHIFPSVESWQPKARLTPEESTLSAWDDVGELLKNGEWLSLDENAPDAEPESKMRLIELGIPELDVVALENGDVTRYVELTGDLARVFDGLF